jgi:Malonate decarboxylase, alpha subunit, transporter
MTRANPQYTPAGRPPGGCSLTEPVRDCQKQRSERNTRLEAGSRYATGKWVPAESAKALLEAVIRPGDRVCLEPV